MRGKYCLQAERGGREGRRQGCGQLESAFDGEMREQQDQRTEIERRTVVTSSKRLHAKDTTHSFSLFVDRPRGSNLD